MHAIPNPKRPVCDLFLFLLLLLLLFLFLYFIFFGGGEKATKKKSTPRTRHPPAGLADFIEAANVAFASVFVAEAALKLFALRGAYFRERWNIFDFAVVAACTATYVLDHEGGEGRGRGGGGGDVGA
jgi:hypothetical protein